MNISTMYSFKIAYFDDKLLSSNKTSNVSSTVADPGFDLGGWTLSTGGVGVKNIDYVHSWSKSHFFACFWPYFY